MRHKKFIFKFRNCGQLSELIKIYREMFFNVGKVQNDDKTTDASYE